MNSQEDSGSSMTWNGLGYKRPQMQALQLNKGLEQYGGITHADILVTCTDEKYQKITLTFSGSATWRKYKPLADFLAKRWKEDGAHHG